MKEYFSLLWESEFVQSAPMITQEPQELYAVFCLMLATRDYESFLEVGSCYGTSLFILAHALESGSRVVSVDLCEEKSAPYLRKSVARLNDLGYSAEIIEGHSQAVTVEERFDVVLIDADHSYRAVKADVEKYRPLCNHLFLMHDIRLDGPGRAFTEAGGGLRINSDFQLKVAPDTGFGVQFL